MNTKHILSSALVGAAILLGSVSPIFAQSPTLPENRQERRENRIERRCDRVNARIDNRIDHFNARKENVLARHKRISERVTAFVDRLEGKGYDVSGVRSDLEALRGMVTTAEPNYTAFIGELEELKQLDCDDSKDAFKQAVEEARSALVKFRSDVKAIRDFLRNTLRPNLQALRGQNPSPSPTE